MNQIQKLDQIRKQALKEIAQAKSASDAEEVNSTYLGRKSELTEILRSLKDLDAETRAQVGAEANKLRTELDNMVSERLQELKKLEFEAQIASESFDVTIPATGTVPGNLHPITKEREIIEDIFLGMGFEVHEPLIVDDDYHNFTSLNIPEGHPARDMWDTIRVEGDNVLITHTSSMQNRIISSSEPPIRAIVPGKCFRNEATDATHEHSFNQVEGIYVDKGIKVSDMLGTLTEFLRQYFGREVRTKIQPTYFPFVEPGLEIMIDHQIGEYDPEAEPNWLEVIPCGMIHPYVIKEAGLDPNVYSGFAWGAGLDRLCMIKYQVKDIRLFHSGRVDFTQQF